MDDVKCPYCGRGQEINHDDGYGYEENETHEQECACHKTFTFETFISFDYSAHKAPCLNGAEHKYKKVVRAPRVINGKEAYRCEWCGAEEDKPSACSRGCRDIITNLCTVCIREVVNEDIHAG